MNVIIVRILTSIGTLLASGIVQIAAILIEGVSRLLGKLAGYLKMLRRKLHDKYRKRRRRF